MVYKGTRAIIPDTFDSIGFTRNLTESEKTLIRDTEPDQKYLAMLESPDPKDKWAVKDIEKYTKVITDPKTGEKKLAYKTWRLKILNSPLAPRLEKYMRDTARPEDPAKAKIYDSTVAANDRQSSNTTAREMMLRAEQDSNYADQLEGIARRLHKNRELNDDDLERVVDYARDTRYLSLIHI